MRRFGKTFLAALIVGGTALGAGMLGLPISTAGGSFYDDLIIYFVCWLFNLATGFLFVEILIYFKEGVNIASMSRKFLGPLGRFFTWGLYLFLFYCLMIAYISSGGSLLGELFSFPSELGMVVFAFIFSLVTLGGAGWSSRINSVLMVGLIATLVWFIAVGAGHITPAMLGEGNFFASLMGLPVIFTSFAYQGTVPSLFAYLDGHPGKTRRAIFYGTLIPFATYIMWDGIFKGSVPLAGLLHAKELGQIATLTLSGAWPGRGIALAVASFSFFAVTTSLVGVALGLYDFLQDGISLPKTRKNAFYLTCFVYFPPLIVALTNPGIFLTALGLAGGIGGTLLLGLMPVLMVTMGRYYYKTFHADQVPGKGITLALLCVFVVLEVFITLFGKFV